MFYKIALGDVIRVPPLRTKTPQVANLKQRRSWLADNILYEDEQVMVVNKPDDLAVHQGTNNRIAVVDYVRDYAQCDSHLVHRLDKNVSGCLVLAKNREVKNLILSEWQNKNCVKRYETICFGQASDDEWWIHTPLVDRDGRSQEASTKCLKMDSYDKMGVIRLEVDIQTGRRHQIRRHLADVNLPIIGDRLYGNFKLNKQVHAHFKDGMYLHAKSITFKHPMQGWITVKAAWPREKLKIINNL